MDLDIETEEEAAEGLLAVEEDLTMPRPRKGAARELLTAAGMNGVFLFDPACPAPLRFEVIGIAETG